MPSTAPLKDLARRAVPGAGDAVRWMRRKRRSWGHSAPTGTREEVFDSVRSSNLWGSTESVSGPGSHVEETRYVRMVLPEVIERHGIGSILDIPCGDMNWIRHVRFPYGLRYIGADIVGAIVDEHRADPALRGLEFRQLDIVRDPLPQVDAVFCRDALVHLSNADVMSALDNMRSSRSRLLISTTFPLRRRNADIKTGDWRPVNLQRMPFNVGAPLELASEGSTRLDGAYADKCLGVWELQR